MQQKNSNGLVSHFPLHHQNSQLPIKDINASHEDHHDTCSCILCQKQKEIEQMKKQRTKLHFQSLYKNDFTKNVSTKRQNKYSRVQNNPQMKRERKEKSLAQIQTYNLGYLELKSTYNNEYVSKKIQISKTRPLDSLKNASTIVPVSTTYMKSYHSVLTPKPDEPFKQLQMPVGTTVIPFSSQSVYQKAYKRQHSPRPNLPFIQRENMSKPKSLGPVQSTQKHSYSTMIVNPESKNIEHIVFKQPTGNLVNLSSFVHSYETTYRNCFMGGASRSQQKHDIDEIGNVNRRVTKAQRK